MHGGLAGAWRCMSGLFALQAFLLLMQGSACSLCFHLRSHLIRLCGTPHLWHWARLHAADVLPRVPEEGERGAPAAAVRHEPQQVPGLPVPDPIPRAGALPGAPPCPACLTCRAFTRWLLRFCGKKGAQSQLLWAVHHAGSRRWAACTFWIASREASAMLGRSASCWRESI